MLLATALALLITGCAQQTFTVQNKPAAVAPKRNHHPSFLRFWIGQKKNCRCSQNLWRRRNAVKTENPANIRKWIARFYYFRHLLLRWSACVLPYNNCMSCPSIWATLFICSLIYFWVPSSCFCIVISLFLRVKQSCSAVSASRGRLHYPRRRWWLAHWLTDCFDSNRRRPAATSSRRASFSALASG